MDVLCGTQQVDTVCFELTDRCPLACGHCSVSAGPARGRMMPLRLFQRLVDIARERGCSEIILAGGEPLALPEFPSYAGFAHDKGAIVSVYTSGNTFEEGAGASIEQQAFRRYREMGVARVVFSVYADTPDVHERITHIPGSFEKTRISIENARAVDLECEINFVPMKPNWRHLAGVLNLAVDLDASKVNCLRFVPQGRGLVNERLLHLDEAEERLFVESATEILGGEFGTMLRLGGSFEAIAPWAVDQRTRNKRSMHVTTMGEMLLSADRRGSLIMGN